MIQMPLQVPETWEFDLHMCDEEVEEAFVRITDGGEFQGFDIEDCTCESIECLFVSKLFHFPS